MALMGLGHLASQNESLRKRVLKGADVIQYIENYRCKDHELIRRKAVQYCTNRCGSEIRGVRCKGNNDKVKYGVLQYGDYRDAAVVAAAACALAMLTSDSNKICKKVVGAKQGNDDLLNGLANTDDQIGLRGAVVVQDTVKSCK